MRHNAAKAFVASAAFDGRLKALEERCSGDRATAQSGRGIEQMVQELRLQVCWHGLPRSTVAPLGFGALG